MKKASLLFFSLLSLASIAHSQTAWNVPGDFNTIQDAINSSVSGDSILVDSGIWAENLNYNGKNVEVVALNGPGSTTIDGQGLGTVVTFSGGTSPGAKLIGFTITGGIAVNGAGISLLASSGTIQGNVVSLNNASGDGGGLFISGADNAAIQDNQFLNNTASRGGGLFVTGQSSLSVGKNSFSGNVAGYGGAISIYENLDSCTIEENVIEGNLSTDSTHHGGAGISCINDTGTIIRNNTIRGNAAVFAGGGIEYLSSTSTLDNNLVIGNTAQYGAGIWQKYGTLDARSCTIVDNIASGSPNHGGGMLNEASATAFLTNMVFWGNAAATGPSIMVGDNSVVSVSYSNVPLPESKPLGSYSESNVLRLDPLFVNQTEFFLSHTATGQGLDSPCIDAGDPVLFVEGSTRSDYFPDTGVIDMGYHHQASAPIYNWVVNPSNGYKYALTYASGSFLDATQEAASIGCNLVTIRSQSEQDWLYQTFGNQWLWIGLTQNHKSSQFSEPTGGWEWMSGEPVTFTNWQVGEPNDSGGDENHAHWFGGGAWNDAYGFSISGQWSQFPGILEWKTSDGILNMTPSFPGSQSMIHIQNGVPDSWVFLCYSYRGGGPSPLGNLILQLTPPIHVASNPIQLNSFGEGDTGFLTVPDGPSNPRLHGVGWIQGVMFDLYSQQTTLTNSLQITLG